LIERNLRLMQTQPLTPGELDRAKILLLRSIPLSESSLQDIAGGLLDRANRDLPLDEPVRAAQRYTTFTAADVQAAFAKWLKLENLAQVVLGPPAK
jgi:zinc protease